jgi:hypothetical protein
MLQLSDRDASILLGAALMHWGVPFRFTTKRALTDHQQSIVDAACDKLRESPRQPLSDAEAALLADVVENCLEECGNDPVELRLQLKTGERREADSLLQRLRASLQSLPK